MTLAAVEKQQFTAVFGARVRTLRERIDPPLSQERAAHQCDWSVSAWHRMEAGKHTPHLARIPDIARVLDVTPGDLFEGLTD